MLVSSYRVAASFINSKLSEHNTENEEFEKSRVLQKRPLTLITLIIIIIIITTTIIIITTTIITIIIIMITIIIIIVLMLSWTESLTLFLTYS